MPALGHAFVEYQPKVLADGELYEGVTTEESSVVRQEGQTLMERSSAIITTRSGATVTPTGRPRVLLFGLDDTEPPVKQAHQRDELKALLAKITRIKETEGGA